MPGAARRPAPSLRSALLRARLRGFWRDEHGAGTMFALFFLAVVVLMAGVLLDSTNAWRNRDLLRLTADVASHAGAVALAEGHDEKTAWATAIEATRLNTPENVYGRIIAEPLRDVRLMHYDPATNTITTEGAPNAVRVRVERSARTNNPVPTLLARLVGQSGWNIATESIAALVPTMRCDAMAGVFAHGPLRFAGGGRVGEGACLHSQQGVRLDATTAFDAGATLSMPDLAACEGRCSDRQNPGVDAAAAEMNLVMSDPAEMVARLSAGFADSRRTLPEETAFFATRPLSEDLSALEEIGVPTDKIGSGSVIFLSPLDFARLREIPAGLTYAVSCAAPEGSEIYGDVAPEVVLSGGDHAPALHDAALVTDCPVLFGPTADVRGALIIALGRPKADRPALVADPAARIGSGGCDPAAASMILVQGDTVLPGAFAAGDVAVVVAGNLGLAPEPGDPMLRHVGVGFHASGRIEVAGRHEFRACAPVYDLAADASAPVRADMLPGGAAADLAVSAESGLPLPGLRVIRHVLPQPPALHPVTPAPTRPKAIVVASSQSGPLIGAQDGGRFLLARD